jgi:hypothetical protein
MCVAVLVWPDSWSKVSWTRECVRSTCLHAASNQKLQVIEQNVLYDFGIPTVTNGRS